MEVGQDKQAMQRQSDGIPEDIEFEQSELTIQSQVEENPSFACVACLLVNPMLQCRNWIQSGNGVQEPWFS